MRYLIIFSLLLACNGDDSLAAMPDAAGSADSPNDVVTPDATAPDDVLPDAMGPRANSADGQDDMGAPSDVSPERSDADCQPDELRCVGLQPQVCTRTWQWEDTGPSCRAACANGVCAD